MIASPKQHCSVKRGDDSPRRAEVIATSGPVLQDANKPRHPKNKLNGSMSSLVSKQTFEESHRTSRKKREKKNIAAAESLEDSMSSLDLSNGSFGVNSMSNLSGPLQFNGSDDDMFKEGNCSRICLVNKSKGVKKKKLGDSLSSFQICGDSPLLKSRTKLSTKQESGRIVTPTKNEKRINLGSSISILYSVRDTATTTSVNIPANIKYGKRHKLAASRITALARGRRARMQAKILRLQKKLAEIDQETARDLKIVRKATSAGKKEFKTRAKDRFQKNLARKGEKDSVLQDAQEAISSLRGQNNALREVNQRLFEDLKKLKINCSRLQDSNLSSSACVHRIAYKEDIIRLENVKRKKLLANYEQAVNDHANQLKVHIAFGDAENRMKTMYRKLLVDILECIECDDNRQLYDEIYAEAVTLEKIWGEKGKRNKNMKGDKK